MNRWRMWTVLLMLTAGWSVVAQQDAPPAPAAPSTPNAPAPPAPPSPAPANPTPVTPAPDAPAEDGSQPSVELTRKGDDGKTRIIRIVKTGTDETGIAAICGPQDGEPEDSPTVLVYSETGAGGVRVSVDKNLIRAPLAVITKKQGGDGRFEVTAGSAKYLDAAPAGKTDRLSRCEVEASPKTEPNTVLVSQGKTSLTGNKLVYDETDGIARIDGPIKFERPGEKSTLTGTSKNIEVNIDKETTTLVGEVVLRDGDRTSSAERVDYDDASNVAVLRGSKEKPAETRTAKDTIRAETIRYNLDSGEAVVIANAGGVTGKFEDDDSGPASAPDQAGGTPASGGSTGGSTSGSSTGGAPRGP